MSGRKFGMLFVLALLVAVLAPACSPLQAPSDSAAVAEKETLAKPNAIPASWGHMVGVSSVNAYPDLVQLWFEDQNGAVRMVVFRVSTHEVLHARIIPRS